MGKLITSTYVVSGREDDRLLGRSKQERPRAGTRGRWIEEVEDLGAEYVDAVDDLRDEFTEELAELKEGDDYQEFTTR